ncbi:hypothetical protein BH23BAC1_BH23BAC1_35720 [soil metagenome]
MAKEYIIYCDESISKGRYYSDFYGGVLISSAQVDEAKQILEKEKAILNLKNEVKWSRVTENYLHKYIQLMTVFFQLVEKNVVKVRIMFRQTAQEPINLTAKHKEIGYFLLYYQFIKHAFGLKYCNNSSSKVHLRL